VFARVTVNRDLMRLIQRSATSVFSLRCSPQPQSRRRCPAHGL